MVDIAVAELQSAPRKGVYVTPATADQMRYMSSFDVLTYVPRDASFAASDMTSLVPMNRFALLHDILLTVLRLGLNDDVPEDGESLNRISHLEASFNEIPTSFRRFLITHYSVVVVVCSCSLVSSTVTWACGKAACRHLCVINIQEPCLPEPAL